MGVTPRRAFSISGIHTVEGAEAVVLDDGSDAAILKVDGEVLVLHAKERAVSYPRHAKLTQILRSCWALGEWPFSQERVALAALKISDQPLHPPLVCNFLLHDGATWAVNESTGLVVLEIRPQNAEAGPGRSIVLPLSSVNLPPRTPARIAARASSSFRPTRLVVLRGANFLVHDVQIGARRRLATNEPLPGDLFSAEQLESQIHLEDIPRGTDVAVVASYVGDDPAGGAFRAALLGRATETPPSVQIRWTPEGRPAPWVNQEDPRDPEHT